MQVGQIRRELGAGGREALRKVLLGPGQGLQQGAAQLEVVVEGVGVVVGVEVAAEHVLNLLHKRVLGRIAGDDQAAFQRHPNGLGELVGGLVGVFRVGGGIVGHHNGRGHVQQHIRPKLAGVEIIGGHRHHFQAQLEIVPGLGPQRNAGRAGFEGPQLALAHAGAFREYHDGAAVAQVVVAAAKSGLVLGGPLLIGLGAGARVLRPVDGNGVARLP